MSSVSLANAPVLKNITQAVMTNRRANSIKIALTFQTLYYTQIINHIYNNTTATIYKQMKYE